MYQHPLITSIYIFVSGNIVWLRKMKKEREDLLPGPTSGLTNSVKVHVSEGTQQEL